MKDLAARLSTLSPRQREILERRLRAEGIDLGEFDGIPRAGERPGYPLSFAQQRLWFLEQLEPGTPVYVVPLALRLEGRLEIAALRRALAELVRRHAPLRTTYPAEGGLPVQTVGPGAGPHAGCGLPAVDLSGLPAAQREAEAARCIAAEAWRPFDIERGPVLRTLLLCHGSEDHALLLAMHHIACDFWSLSILLRELTQLHAAFARGLPSPLPPLPVEYTDFAVWQRERLEGEAIARELAWWRERLADPPPPLELPADRPRPRTRSYRGGSLPLALPAAALDGLRELARRERGTLFMTLLAGLYALLARYTGNADLVVGTPTASRPRTELEGLVGCFINTLALRADLSGEPTFAELVERVRGTVLGAQAHGNVPFERVVEAVQPDRDPGATGDTPLFQVMFVLQNAPQEPVALPGLALRPVELASRKSELDLTMTVWEAPAGLRGWLELNTDIFDIPTALRLAGHLQRLLAGAAADPGLRLPDLPLVGEAELHQLLREWSPEPSAPTVLDRAGRLVPIGVPGEVWIGGPGVGSPELTAERLPEAEGRRARRSGELARWRPDGALEHLGRADRRLQVRGSRIEPGERPEPAAAWAAPAGPVEEALAAIFAGVLKLDRVGRHDNFFRSGGHSLLATQAVSRAREALAANLPLRSLFEAPTVAGLAAAVERLRGRTEPVEQGEPALGPSPLRAAGGPFPLSFSQERLWFLDQLEPGTPAYNIPAALRLEGRLDPGALHRALSEIVRRHEALRTALPAAEGGAVQRISAPAPVPLPRIDLSSLPAGARETELGRLWRRESAAPFDLARGPLLRVRLIRLAAEDHLLTAVVHHIVADGWSISIFQRELARLYGAFAAGLPSPLAELPLQYADFADWQRRWLSGEVLERQLAYWRGQLAGVPALELRGDRPRPPVQTFRGGQVPFALAEDVAGRLAGLAHGRGASLFMALLAGFQALLQRYTGQDDFAAGTFIANRNRRGIEDLIGFFVNNLAVRADLAQDPGLDLLLERVREATLGAYAHQDLPFERLLEELRPERDMSRPSIFQVMCVLLNLPAVDERLPGLSLSGMPLASHRANFDLTLWMSGGPAGVEGALEYNADLLDAGTARRMAGHLERLLAAASAAPDRPVSSLPLLSAEESRQLAAWSAAPAPWQAGVCVHELFERQAAQTPDAVAVSAPAAGEAGGPWTRLAYCELNRRANRLARHLRRLGAGPEVRIGICLERTADLVVAALAVLKSGACYVPLDPAYSRERLAFMLGDARVSLVLTSRAASGPLPAAGGARLLLLDDGQAAVEAGEDGNLHAAETGVRPGHLAYVIYTSGSTGRPKGAMVEHRSLANAYLAWEESYRLRTEATAHLQMASFSFDVWAGDLVRALLSGGRLVLCPRELLLEPERLYELMVAERVDAAELVPSVARGLADLLARTGRSLDFMRLMIVGSDAWYARELSDLARLCGERTRLINSYGVSEATIDTTFWEHGRGGAPAPGGAAGEGLVPIGSPFGGSEVHLLDRNLEPVPAGVPGELAIGGLGLARGYHGRPELTAERFVPHPFSPEPGRRLYLTGDLARWLPAGEVELLGRVDHQVKVRGHRIEPGEVEAALGEHPAVRQAVVLALPDRAGEKRLAAFVVPREGAAGGVPLPDLRSFLRARLPDFMVPSAFAVLATLPLTPNGKVDRRSLASLETAALEPPAPAADGGAAAPRTPVEEMLAGIWAEVLCAERVGANDSFFDLGGHSLLATQLVSRVRRAFGIELPLRALFEAPTPAALARRVEAAMRAADGTAPPPIAPRPAGEEAPLSFAQQRLWFLDRMEPGSPLYNLPAAVRIRGPLDPAVLAAGLTEVVRRHEALRTTFPAQGGRPRQEVAPPPRLAPPRVDLAALPQDRRQAEALRLAREEAREPFDLTRGPLLRARLLRLGAEEHAVLLTLHHIAADAWSIQVLISELAALYGAFAARRPSPLPELPVQYADFAAWQRRWLDGGVLAAQLAWWRARLSDPLPPPLLLPADRPRPPVQTLRGARLPLALGAGLSQDLARASARAGVSLFMTLLAGFEVLLSRWTGQEDFAVGAPIANRGSVELEGLIGFFVNTLALRSDLAGSPRFADLLASVKETALGAYAHQDLPFDRLVEELQPPRDPARAPLFQVMFVFQNVPPPAAAGAGLAMEPLEVDSGTAKFELGLELYETPAGLCGSFEYNAGLFDRATVARMAGHLATLLAAAAADPGCETAGLPLLSPAERHQLLLGWNDTRGDEPEPIHGRIAARAARQPESPAVEDEHGRVLGFGELIRRSRSLGRRLRRLGVRPEIPVAVALDRSAELPVALLAVWEAGGVYLPLDPEQPRERLAAILEDAGAPVLLTRRDLLPALPEGPARRVFAEDLEEDGGGGSPEPPAGGDGLAYLIYTSGSTGRPKGVMLSRRGLDRLVPHMVELFGVRPGDRFAQMISPGFDASLLEMLTALAGGATLVPAGAEARLPGPELGRWLRERSVTQMVSVPSALGATPAEGLPALRAVSSGAERLPAEVAARWSAGRRLLNCYGPTETSILVTAGICREPGAGPQDPPIGRPVPDARIHLLDPRLEPVPAGVAGEVCLAGPALARGYFGRPDLTAERFVPDPFASAGEAGGRLYRTGDLARRLPDGEIDFLGRADRQVKIRGVRVEPGEVEAVLESHPGVLQAAVEVRQGAAGPQLLGYVVPRGAAAAGLAAALRAWLRERLPEALLPSGLILLERMPLSPAGKVDRRALPEPAESGWTTAEISDGIAAPRAPAEEMVAGLWAELLGRDEIGVNDDFFDLGGHSLLAVQAVSRLRDAFGVEIPLRQIFERPTPAALAAALAAMPHAGSASQAPPLAPVLRDGRDLPLSFGQARLWVLDRLQPGSSAYNLPFALRLAGPLDPAALEWSLGEIAGRHEVLRTTYGLSGGRPVQRIAPAAPWSLPRLDLTGLPAAARDAETRRVAREEGARPFDLERGPVLRSLLLRLAGDEHAALLTVHHIASDAWSTGVLVRELGALYSARCAGRPSPLPELPVQYADFAAWQAAWLQGEALDAQLAFWRTELEGAPGVLDLPLDRPRTPDRGLRGGSVPFAVPPESAAGLRRLARSQGATLFMVLLAAFQALLARLCRQDDLVIGTPVANRTRGEVEGLIGFFVNTLALRARTQAERPLRDLVAQARATALAAYAHQDLPFERLVDELHIERSLSHNPVFQVMLALQNTPSAALELAGVRWEPIPGERTAVPFDLSFALGETAGALGGALEYAAALFDRTTAARLARRFATLLAGIAAEPEAPLCALPLLTAAEHHQIAAEWGLGQPAAPAAAATVPELIAAQAERRPDAVAVVFQGEQLTYGDLLRRARGLARRLRFAGVSGGAPVGLCLERSLDLVVGLVGIFEAGGAFLPLDPAYPAARRELLLRDSGARAVIAAERIEGEPAFAGLPVLSPGEMRGEEETEAPLPGRPAPEDAAYVIYTSGTTGTPKGVVTEHRSIVSTLQALQDDFAWSADDRTASVSPFSFDAFLLEVLPPLISGACVEIMPLGPALDFGAFAGALSRLTRVHAVASLMRQLTVTLRERQSPPEARAGVRTLLTGSEAVPADLLAELARMFPAARTCVLYGPTEAAIVCTRHHVPPAGPFRNAALGRPFAGAEIRVCDPAERLVPIGTPGELWVGGPLVGRGYAGRPELTAERFVERGGRRFFRTGDLARWLPTGELEFLGRMDHQVKVRGFRIELGEIEAALTACAGVREAAVVVRGETHDRRLVAFLVPEGPPPGAGELRRHLAGLLPGYMVPAAFVPLAALPLSRHGKVDRKALEQIEAPLSRPDLQAAFAAPRTAAEQVLAGMWAEILGVDRVGIDDDFFALGGHSLLATQLLSWVRDSFEIDLPLRRVFEEPTVAGLAAALSEGSGDPAELERTAELLLQVTALSEEDMDEMLERERA